MKLRLTVVLLMSMFVHSASYAQQIQPLPERITPEKTWSDHRWIGSDGTDFHYVEQGEGTPIVLIHGLTSSAIQNWFNPGIAQKLAKTNRVIAIDMRGHGDTKPSPEDSNGTMINDIVEFLDYLKIDKAHIGGYSMGGATTGGLLNVIPERFITAAIMGIGIKETSQWTDNTPTDGDGLAAGSLSNPRLALNSSGVPRGAPKGAPNPNPEVDLTQIRFPVLALNGGNDRPLAKTHRMWRELIDFKYVVIPGRNHLEAARDPLFGDALVRFIVANNP